MLEMIRGCNVSKSSELFEQFEAKEDQLIANVNASKIELLIKKFINNNWQKLFFILEVPANKSIEEKMRKNDTDPFHKAVYYIDGLDPENCLDLLAKYGDLLINDGISSFGFGVHGYSAEIMCCEFNVVRIYAKDTSKFENMFLELGIKPTMHCKTAWETFNENNPGDSFSIKVDGKTVYDIIEDLNSLGMYLAEIRIR